MFGYIKGKVTERDGYNVIIESNGMGYEVAVSNSALVKIAESADIKLYTYLAVKEDGISLYGFGSKEEKNMFLRLISISNVGPKSAMCVLSGIDLNTLIVAIISADVKTLGSVKGIGKKTAERIILELREKLEYTVNSVPVTLPSVCGRSKDVEDAILALRGLGIPQTEAENAVNRASQKAKSIEELVTFALKNLN